MRRILFLCLCFFAINGIYAHDYISHVLNKPHVLANCPSLKMLENRANMVLRSGKVGLTKQQLMLAFRFIETMMKEGVNTYTVHETRIPCVIERSPLLNGILIRSIRNKDAFIGRGYFKTVSKVILYGRHPKVLAECSGVAYCKAEIDILEKIRGEEGIVPYFGAVPRAKKFLFYYEYFPQGTLGAFFAKNKTLELRQTAKIFHDLAKGVRALHKRGYVHRDLHEGNVLIDITLEKCSGALIDFGLTILSDGPDDGTVQGSFRKCPPEPLVKDISTIDRFAVDVYALGCLLYQAVWGQPNPWHEVFNIYLLKKYSSSVRRELYARIQSLYESSKSENIGSVIQKCDRGDPLTPLERIKLLTYQMLDVAPEERPTIGTVIAVLEEVLADTNAITPSE